MLREFDGVLGSLEHQEWIAQSQALQKSYRARRRAWLKSVGWPWPPRRPDDRTPPPLTGDWDSTEEG